MFKNVVVSQELATNFWPVCQELQWPETRTRKHLVKGATNIYVVYDLEPQITLRLG